MEKTLVFLLGLMLIAGTAFALCPSDCEVFWTAPTTYTDNTSIEAADLPLSYVVEWDGTLLPPTLNTFAPLPKPYGHGVSHTIRVRARSARGTDGVFSPPFPWSSPEGVPGSATGIGVR